MTPRGQIRDASPTQLRVLKELATRPYGRTTAYIFNELCRSSKTVRVMFAKGFVQGDQVPAVYVSITDAGMAAIKAASVEVIE